MVVGDGFGGAVEAGDEGALEGVFSVLVHAVDDAGEANAAGAMGDVEPEGVGIDVFEGSGKGEVYLSVMKDVNVFNMVLLITGYQYVKEESMGGAVDANG